MAKEFSVNMLLLSPLNAFVRVRTAESALIPQRCPCLILTSQEIKNLILAGLVFIALLSIKFSQTLSFTHAIISTWTSPHHLSHQHIFCLHRLKSSPSCT